MSSGSTVPFGVHERVTMTVRRVKQKTSVTIKGTKDQGVPGRACNVTNSSDQSQLFKAILQRGGSLKPIASPQSTNPDKTVDRSKARTIPGASEIRDSTDNKEREAKNPDKIIDRNISRTIPGASESRDSADKERELKKPEAGTRSEAIGKVQPITMLADCPSLPYVPTRFDVSKFKVIQTKRQIEYIDIRNESMTQKGGSCLFVGNLPEGVSGLELAYLFGKVGPLHSVRRMMEDSFEGKPKSFAFVTFLRSVHARQARIQYQAYEIRKRMNLIVQEAFENNVLFVANVPKTKCKEHLYQAFSSVVKGLKNVIVYKSMNGRNNRGFCFLEFGSHKDASTAKIYLTKRSNPVSDYPLFIDWADEQQQPGDDVMRKVKRVYVSNLSPSTSETDIYHLFSQFGIVEKVKKIRNYAFVHFLNRHSALMAIDKMDNAVVDGETIRVVLSKPPIDMATRQEMLMKREKRLSLKMKKDLDSRKSSQNNQDEAKLSWYKNTPAPQLSPLYAYNYTCYEPVYMVPSPLHPLY